MDRLEYEIVQSAAGIRLAKEISNLLNKMDHDAFQKAFMETMQRDHRTLQQQFTEFCFEWLKICASEKYGVDGRNEYSQKVARKALSNLEEYEMKMPFI